MRALEMEVEQVDEELEKIRQKKMEALEEKAKAVTGHFIQNHVMSEHENAEIYSEMEEMICRKSK